MIRQLLSNKWQQSGFKDVTEQNSIHDAIKDTNLCGTMSADPSPNMNFNRMLQCRLSFRRLVNLPVTSATVLFKGNRAFVREDHVVESVATFRDTLNILESFHLVWFSYELTIRDTL